MLSVVILTKNEEKNIVDCLETVLWADEIIIIDDYSQDRTLEVVKSIKNKKIRIFENNLDNDFSKQRNFGLSKTTKKWVLFLDADERVTPDLKEEINSVIINNQNNKVFGYYIKRTDIMWGKTLKHGEVGSLLLLRLGKRDSGIWMGKVHEEWMIEGKTEELSSELKHYPHQTISDFLNEINFYSTLRAKDLFERRANTSVFEIIIYPKAKFFKNYILKLGFMDGLEGLVFAIMMSLHSFLVRSKLWELWQKTSN